MKLSQPPVAFFFKVSVLAVSILPFPLIYLISDLLAFMLRNILMYRRSVVTENIRASFPGIREEELQVIVRKSYSNLTDVLMEGIKAFSMTKKQINKRHVILNPEILDPFRDKDQSVIVVSGHYCNWEWGVFSASLQTNYHIVGFYKPIQNVFIDQLVRENRSKFGSHLASIRETSATFASNRGRPVIYLMAADQSPSNSGRAYWLSFFGRETAFLHGP